MNLKANIKLVALSLISVLLFGVFTPASDVNAASGDTIVYITKTGECYHTSGCSSLRKSKIETTLQNAINKGLRPCSKCHPGTLDSASASTASATTTKATTTKAATAVTVDPAIEALKTYKGNTAEFNAYTYYINNTDLQTAIGPDGDKLLKHYKDYGKAEGRKAK